MVGGEVVSYTYKTLLEALLALPEERLQATVCLYDRHDKKIAPITGAYFYRDLMVEHRNALSDQRLEDDQPMLIMGSFED